MISNVTVIIPAHNEEERIFRTLKSVVLQTLHPKEIIVVIDNCTDRTEDEARRYLSGLFEVYKVPYKIVKMVGGSKAKAQNAGLKLVTTKYVIAIDADTILEDHAIQRIVAAVEYEGAVAASSWVMTQKQNTWAQKGRTIEYLFSFVWFKRVQDYYHRPLIASGCFNIYKTSILRKIGGYPEDTLAEDMNATWEIHKRHLGRVLFVPDAIVYTDDPKNLSQLKNQLARWSCAYFQNYRKHHDDLMHRDEFTGFLVLTGLVNNVIGSLFYLLVVGLLFIDPVFALMMVAIDWGLIGMLAYLGARKLGVSLSIWKMLPSFTLVTIVNSYYFLKYMMLTGVFNKSIPTYVKGH